MSCTSFFGLITSGDCSPKLETVTNAINKQTSKVMNDTLIKQMSTNKLSTQQVQRVTGRTKIGNVNIRDLNLEQRSNISLDSFQQMQTEQQVQDMMKQLSQNLVEEILKNSTELGAPPATTSTTTNLQNIMEKEVVNKMTLEQMNKCIASVYQDQRILGESEIGDVNIFGINMQQTADATAKCVGQQVAKNLFDSAALQKALNDLTKEAEVEGKGFGSLVGDFFKGLGKFVGGFTNLAIIGGVIFVILMLVFLFFLFSGGGGGGAAVAPAAGYATPTAGYATPTAGYAYSPQYGRGLGGFSQSFWAKYPAMAKMFDVLKY